MDVVPREPQRRREGTRCVVPVRTSARALLYRAASHRHHHAPPSLLSQSYKGLHTTVHVVDVIRTIRGFTPVLLPVRARYFAYFVLRMWPLCAWIFAARWNFVIFAVRSETTSAVALRRNNSLGLGFRVPLRERTCTRCRGMQTPYMDWKRTGKVLTSALRFPAQITFRIGHRDSTRLHDLSPRSNCCEIKSLRENFYLKKKSRAFNMNIIFLFVL